MNQITPPPKIEIIPGSAPFSEAQRSWLNGFFAGLLSDAPTPLSAEQGAAVMDGGDDGEAPWHDQTMPIADRMKLAEGRPLRRRFIRHLRPQRPRPGGPDHRAARRLAYDGGEGQDVARGLARRRLVVAGAGLAVRADLLSDRRRAAREGPCAGARRGSRWRRRL